MLTKVTDRNKYFKLVKKSWCLKKQTNLTALHTPAGDSYGKDTLEGFAIYAELLGSYVGECSDYDNEFYNLCIPDNCYIFDFKDNSIKIQKMKIEDIEKVIDKEMKRGKACWKGC